MRLIGVSGFRTPVVTVSAFKAALYAAARADGSEVSDLREPGVTPSFFSARLRSVRREVLVLCDPDTGLVAFARPPLAMGLEFVHGGAVAEAFAALGWTCATPEFLERPLTAEEVAALSEAERKQIAYWSASTVGAILFHWFD